MEFNIVQKLFGMTLLGTEWVLWLLIGLSILSIAIMLDRAIYYRRIHCNFSEFSEKLFEKLKEKDLSGAKDVCQTTECLESKVALEGLNHFEHDNGTLQGSMESVIERERYKLDKGLIVLGTLGNNAPFIGLFGTVLGIIQAFHALSEKANAAGLSASDAGSSAVMKGISEALVATAVGLLVAIPAVVMFNWFNRIVKTHIANSYAIAKTILLLKN